MYVCTYLLRTDVIVVTSLNSRDQGNFIISLKNILMGKLEYFEKSIYQDVRGRKIRKNIVDSNPKRFSSILFVKKIILNKGGRF